MRKLLLKHMTDYCWMTRADMIKLLEYASGREINKNSLSAVLCHMTNRGEFVRKRISETNDKYLWRLK